MDGLTIKSAESLIKSGNTSSEIQSKKNSPLNAKESGDGSFANSLNDAITKVNDMQVNSNQMMEKLATGETKNIPEVMVAAEKADIALKLMVQVRNKMIDAYQEIMKMQV
ncbi:MAG: flagellar hook-basal body complex protein FliE [Bdellovibrionales bacterium]|nr:flagellar hook-basal body complex protein FliE [Bdellovibrionales bacterium]